MRKYSARFSETTAMPPPYASSHSGGTAPENLLRLRIRGPTELRRVVHLRPTSSAPARPVQETSEDAQQTWRTPAARAGLRQRVIIHHAGCAVSSATVGQPHVDMYKRRHAYPPPHSVHGTSFRLRLRRGNTKSLARSKIRSPQCDTLNCTRAEQARLQFPYTRARLAATPGLAPTETIGPPASAAAFRKNPLNCPTAAHRVYAHEKSSHLNLSFLSPAGISLVGGLRQRRQMVVTASASSRRSATSTAGVEHVHDYRLGSLRRSRPFAAPRWLSSRPREILRAPITPINGSPIAPLGPSPPQKHACAPPLSRRYRVSVPEPLKREC